MRNCSGKGKPAKIMLNGTYYTRCPIAISHESFIARHLVNIYFECREYKRYPYDGSWGQQTAFTASLFNYLDSIVIEARKRQTNESKNK